MDLKEALKSVVSTEQVKVFEAVYDEIATDPKGLTKKQLCKEAFGLEEGYFADRIFSLFDADGSKRMNKDEFVLGMSALISKDQGEFVDFLFDIFDSDGSGEIDKEELYQGMLASLRANKLSLAHRIEEFFDGHTGRHNTDDEKRASELTEDIFKSLHHQNDEGITKTEFRKVYLQFMQDWGQTTTPITKNRITTRKFQQYLLNNLSAQENPYRFKTRSFNRRIRLYIKQNPRRVFWSCIWILITLGLFLWKFLQYALARPEAFELLGYCICFARASAEALKFNIALTLLMMCRSLLTFIRNLGNGEALQYINLDDNVAAHKIGGIVILVLSAVHTAAHICDFHRIGKGDLAAVNSALGTSYTQETKPSEVELWFSSWQGLTGLAMLLCFVIAYPGILDWMRKKGHFHIFWGTHQLLIVFTVIVMIHGIQSLLEPYTAVYYIAGPFALYITDRIRRSYLFLRQYRTIVFQTKRLPPNVLEIRMEKGNFRKYKAGQYVFLNVPEISYFEWHPFTLTSAPDDPYLSVHVRKIGGWTKALHKLYGNEKDEKIDVEKQVAWPKLYVDGPYGAPSQAYERYKVCLFVAAGIGITPYASILSHILNQIRAYRGSTAGLEMESFTPIKKIYLVWTTRDESSVIWFDKILQDFYEVDVSELVEIHHYYTAAYEKGDLRNSLIGLAHSIRGREFEEKFEGKLFNPNRSRYYSHYGRPKWSSILEGIKHACHDIDNRCGIFATVPPAFGRIVREAARQHSDSTFKFHYTSENF